MPDAPFWIALVLSGALSPWASAQTTRQTKTPADPLITLEATISAAENSLRDGELQIAESRYRAALAQGWLLVGELAAGDQRLADARDAFVRASTSAVEATRALQSLALVDMQMGNAPQAGVILTGLAHRHPRDMLIRRLLAQALVSSGRPEEAVQELEEARGVAPDDLELTFLLASGYLRLKKVDAAERLFGQIAAARPAPQTYVLIGRTYRDAGEYDRARAALTTALRKDPRARRAHYYLGTVAIMAEGVVRLEEAITEFQRELKLGPADPVTNLRLGMALVEAQRPAAALPPLQLAVRSESPSADAFHYLGRCQLALDKPAEAVTSLRRALDLSQGAGADELRVLSIHYQLALALRRLGATEAAATHFAEAERASARRADTSRERLARYLGDVSAPQTATGAVAPADPSPILSLPPARRTDVKRRVDRALARAYLNLGVLHAQGQRFARAAELFEQAAAVDPEFPQVQYSLAVAYFNQQQYDKAAAPLTRALATNPGDSNVRRMLALTSLNIEAYAKAADLLQDDPQREADPSLQYAYGLALVRSNRAAEAEALFTRLLAEHSDTPELSVVLGQAHAQQGDFDAAIRALRRALELKADVADANATLGLIYLKQGRLPEAADALRAELQAHPGDLKSRHNLATVLDLEGQPQEALSLLRSALKSKPDFADARYLLGKILLAQGAAPDAAEQLEAAARLAPEDANIHYQLAQAYQKLGRVELAEQQFELFRQLKDKRGGRTP